MVDVWAPRDKDGSADTVYGDDYREREVIYTEPGSCEGRHTITVGLKLLRGQNACKQECLLR